MGLIYHMLPEKRWRLHEQEVLYAPETLDTDGFIHCTGRRELLHEVANRFYRNEAGAFVVLMIDETRVSAPIRWEAADGQLFPHLYGPLNLGAVREVRPLMRMDAGRFLPF